jgi:hypothetical protein
VVNHRPAEGWPPTGHLISLIDYELVARPLVDSPKALQVVGGQRVVEGAVEGAVGARAAGGAARPGMARLHFRLVAHRALHQSWGNTMSGQELFVSLFTVEGRPLKGIWLRCVTKKHQLRPVGGQTPGGQ